MDKDLIIFDLDGTLVDSSNDIVWVANKTLESMGHHVMEKEVIKGKIGWGVAMLLAQLMPQETKERLWEGRELFLDLYASHLLVDTVLYPGVAGAIDHFKRSGKLMAILTNKPEALSVAIIDELFPEATFAKLIGGDTLDVRKPDPRPIFDILKCLNIDSASAVMVGDSPVDIEAGQGAGVATIGAGYGFRGASELTRAGADLVIEGFAELTGIIR